MDRADATVLLFHGLWMNRASMMYLARRLTARGYRTHSIGYFSTLRSLEDNLVRVGRAFASASGSVLHVVAHSMGGVMALRALADAPEVRVRRMVLLGVPIDGCVSGRQFAQSRWGAGLLGASKALWLTLPKLEIPGGVEAGAIAGTQRFGLGSLMMRLPKPNDGVVMVAETRHSQLADHTVMPVAHSEMLISSPVARQVCVFLEAGRFAR